MKINPKKLYEILKNEYGDPNWWPVDKKYHTQNRTDFRFEILIGAILTQNTAWSNVEKALMNLKKQKKLDIDNILEMETKEIGELIKPSGYFNQKAKRLKEFTSYIKNNYNSNLDRFFNRDIREIRKELLSLNGIGPETADSMILYAGNLPIFVVDAYTKRICARIPLETKLSYNEIQKFFQKELKKEEKDTEKILKIFNELHALIVYLAKDYCRKKPKCLKCPISKYCEYKKELF